VTDVCAVLHCVQIYAFFVCFEITSYFGLYHIFVWESATYFGVYSACEVGVQ